MPYSADELVTIPDLIRLRNAVTAFIPDDATIARTTVTTKVRVIGSTKRFHPGAIPYQVLPPIWEMTFREGTDVRVEDVVTVVGHAAGVYRITFVGAPGTFSGLVPAHGIKDGIPDGNATATVTFTNNQTNQTTDPVAVVIYPEQPGDQILPNGTEHLWTVAIPPTLRYPDGSRIHGGHQINWDYLPDGTATISKPYPTQDPIFHRWIAHFKEPS